MTVCEKKETLTNAVVSPRIIIPARTIAFMEVAPKIIADGDVSDQPIFLNKAVKKRRG
jgi:hypothetical protein